MPRAPLNPEAPFQSISHAAQLTHFSQSTIRKGCINGTIPHIMVGREYRVNMQLWLDQLKQQSYQNMKNGCTDTTTTHMKED